MRRSCPLEARRVRPQSQKGLARLRPNAAAKARPCAALVLHFPANRADARCSVGPHVPVAVDQDAEVRAA
eukprot:5172297-Lingulodinium_polyedra.AAC.1